MKKLILGSGIILIISILVVVIVLILDANARSVIGVELIKAFLQVAVIATLGGLTSLLAQEFNRNREKRDALNEFRKTLVGQLVQVYRETKKVRRMLRAKRDSLVFYDEQMVRINELQLDLENIYEEIRTTEQAFPEDDVLSRVKKLAKYLNKLVDEYEKNMPKLSSKSPSISIEKLEYLNEFIAPFGEDESSMDFYRHYTEALKSMRKQIMG